jgi:DNA-binding IclR family transcriptional regulator
VNNQESITDLVAVAVPLKDRAGRTIGAVTMSAPSSRMPRARIREIVIKLRECAVQIRTDLAR